MKAFKVIQEWRQEKKRLKARHYMTGRMKRKVGPNTQAVNKKKIDRGLTEMTKGQVKNHMYLLDSDLQLRNVVCTLMSIFIVRNQKY